MSKTTTASSGGQVRGAKKVQRKKSNRRRFDASKVKKSSVKRGSASGSITKKAIEAVTEKGHRKVSQKRQATTVTIIDSGQGSSGVGSPGSGTGDSLNDESDYNNQFSTAFTKKKAATTTTTKSQPLHHKDSNHGHHGHTAAASSGEGSTETNSPESSDFDDLNDQTCPFCEADWTECVHETDEDQAGGPLLYCSKGSLCSRRSKATLKSRKVPGKRKKLPLPPKHQLQQQPQRHPTVSAFIYEVPNVVRTKSSFRDMHRVVRKGYCFVVLCVYCVGLD